MWISAEDGWEGMEMIASLFGTWELGGGGDFGRGGLQRERLELGQLLPEGEDVPLQGGEESGLSGKDR